MQGIVEKVIKRNGEIVPFTKERIFNAVNKAFLSESISNSGAVMEVTEEVCQLVNQTREREIPGVEFIQDIVEATLMRKGHYKVARNYILYREKHKRAREKVVETQIKENRLEIRINDHETVIFNPSQVEDTYRQLTPDLYKVTISELVESVTKQVYDKIPKQELDLLILGSARERIERHYDYSKLASRISLSFVYQTVLGHPMNTAEATRKYRSEFANYIEKGIALEMLTPEMKEFDLDKLNQAIDPNRDKLFHYLGTQIIVDRYLLRDRSSAKAVYELPQWFWMRVAMGLALKETHKDDWAIAFYNVLSNMDLVSSTPTLFNSGTRHSQMSSCYLNHPEDSLDSIFKLFADNARLSKWAGGIGTDWSYVRATGSKIKGTNGESQGVIPFIKIFNDVALAVNQGGKRKGAMCAYMEVWHLDFEQFIELRKNTGDERRRAHDINTAAWIPDLFMKRVQEDGKWTLFCPNEAKGLHDLYGAEFEKRYLEYEEMNLPRAKTINASDLWKRMVTMLYETGHPWITFKDAANVRNPQDHAGVIHSSNLCTEITLNTSAQETAVCNLASLNLANMIVNGKLNEEKVQRTVEIGVRMLDNVIDNNYYPIPEAETANLNHRAVGLGLMGYQDALYKLNISFDSEENLEFADYSMEVISYYAILGSSKLSKERGSYPSYPGSKWSKGLFPIDTLDLLQQQRGREINIDRTSRMDWSKVKEHVQAHGMRNSNTMAIAPTATIANISGVYPCTEPAFKNQYMKENLSGNFLVINCYLIDDLEKIGLWNEDTLRQLKINNGSVAGITSIPEALRRKYQETFELDSTWIVRSAAKRSKWIDQSASTNIFTKTSSGRMLSNIYFDAWEMGLKTTYYLRTQGASQISKASVEVPTAISNAPSTTSSSVDATPQPSNTAFPAPTSQEILAASMMTEEVCEACQ